MPTKPLLPRIAKGLRHPLLAARILPKLAYFRLVEQPAARRRAERRARINTTEQMTLAGRTFTIPRVGGVSTPAQEPWMTDVLRRIFSTKTGAFLDVGVNLGQTLLKTAALDPERPYLGFELNPSCVAYLERLIAVNRLSAQVLPVGLGASTTLIPLEVRPGNEVDASATIIPGFRPWRTEGRVKLAPIFAFGDIPEALIPAPVGVVKIDVEGAELFVLQSMIPLLERDRPIVTVEILPCYAEDRGRRYERPGSIERQHAVEKLMTDRGYRCFRILHPTGASRTTLQPITELGLYSTLDFADHIFCPAEEAEALAKAFA